MHMSTREWLVLYCSNGKYGWCTDSCPLLDRWPLLVMSIVRGSTVYVTCLHTCHCVIAIYYPCVALSLVHNMTQVIPRPRDAMWRHTKTCKHGDITLYGISSYCNKSYNVAQNCKKVYSEWQSHDVAACHVASQGLVTTCVILWTRLYMYIM